MPTRIYDSFGRNVSSGMGTSDAGNVWTTVGTATSVNVNGTKLVLTAPAGGGAGGSTPLDWYEYRGSFKFAFNHALNNVDRIQFSGDSNFYFRLEDTTANSVRLEAYQGTGPIQLSNSTTLAYTYGDEWYCKVEVIQNTLKGKMWKVGDAEPDWQTIGYYNTSGVFSQIIPGTFIITQNNFNDSAVQVTIDELDIQVYDPRSYAIPFVHGKGAA